MPGLQIYTSNRLEILIDRLAQIVRQPAAGALQPEVVIVQSRGMERWISMRLARLNGICGNMTFPFPNAFLEGIFRHMVPEITSEAPFEPPVMTFRIMKILPYFLDRPEFNGLKQYLADDDRKLKRYQLAEKIADLFDQYLVFRPELIFQWEAGENGKIAGDRWQAALWRALVKGKETLHRAYLQKKLLARTKKLPADALDLPPRISLFGISYLPPYHLQAFAAISRLTQINFFLLNPCQEYWADILSEAEIRRWVKKFAITEGSTQDYHLNTGNALLSSMAGLGRDFFALINQCDCDTVDRFEDIRCRDMLSCIQADILHLREHRKGRAPESFPTPDSAARPAPSLMTAQEAPTRVDGSIQIHSCHSPIREIEVLHDQLLAMFEADPDLTPRDVIVMAPDIDTYAPLIDAVFATQVDSTQSIPFSIADRSATDESPIIRGFMSLLDLRNSRLGASRVLAILRLPSVLERYGMSPNDLKKIETWVRDLNIRWGRDASSRQQLGLPALSGNSWQAGLDRIMLGLAMPGYGKQMFGGILPYDYIEGTDAKPLGRFVEFLQRVFQWVENLEQPRTLTVWQSTLIELLDQFFYPNEDTETDIQLIRNALEDFGQRSLQAGYGEEIDLEVVRAMLGRAFERRHHGPGFISGGITFCAMLPMRSIPFKVVCLIGMNDDAFPRDRLPLGFDLIRLFPRPGDRSQRSDDRYLFLEAIISARQILYISYAGQSIEDNTTVPPAVPVSELIDYIENGFDLSEDQIVTRHPLQSFSRRYFTGEDPQLFSYSKENLNAVRSAGSHRLPAVFIAEPLPEPSRDWRHLRVEQLIRFFKHPVKFLLRHRLGLNLEAVTPVSEDKENFSLNALDRYRVGQDILKTAAEGLSPAAAFSIQEATGAIPQGAVGQVWYNRLDSETAAFADKLNAVVQDQVPDHKEIDLPVGDYRLSGQLSGLYPTGRIQARFADRKAGDLLTAWVAHLLLNIDPPAGCAPVTTLVNRDTVTRFKALAHAETVLNTLLDVYWEGLSMPLHFFPETAWAYSRMYFEKGRVAEKALDAARKKWLGDAYYRGEIQNPYNRRCFENADPLDQRFRELAERIYYPIFEHLTEIVI